MLQTDPRQDVEGLELGCERIVGTEIDGIREAGGLLGRPRIRDLIAQHSDRARIGSPAYIVKSGKNERILVGRHTWEGDCLEIKRSCCNVRSTVLCFWKFCRAFEGPHKPSAMM
jgi:hypothetical protein